MIFAPHMEPLFLSQQRRKEYCVMMKTTRNKESTTREELDKVRVFVLSGKLQTLGSDLTIVRKDWTDPKNKGKARHS